MVKEKKSKDDNLFKFIGKRIRQKRKELKISQGVIADLLDISDTQIFKFETGESKIALDYLFKIADFFHADINYFFPENEKITHFSAISQLEKRIVSIKKIYSYNDENLIDSVNNCIDSIQQTILKKQQKQKERRDAKPDKNNN